MDFAFTEEQEFFRQTVRDTIDRMIMPKVQELDESEEFSFDLWHEFRKLGYLGIRHPEEYGGIDFTRGMLNLEIRRDGKGIPLPVSDQPLDTMNIEGFFPVIINVTPIPNLPLLMGMKDKSDKIVKK